MTIALDKTLSAVFNSAGVARIVALPDRARDTWKVTRYVCHTSSAPRTTLSVYKGSENQGSRIDFTNSGNDDVSENFNEVDVMFGRPLTFVWTGGTVGAVAEIAIYGEIVKR